MNHNFIQDLVFLFALCFSILYIEHVVDNSIRKLCPTRLRGQNNTLLKLFLIRLVFFLLLLLCFGRYCILLIDYLDAVVVTIGNNCIFDNPYV